MVGARTAQLDIYEIPDTDAGMVANWDELLIGSGMRVAQQSSDHHSAKDLLVSKIIWRKFA